ncbi:MAG: fructose-6-phosphate aldolase [Bacteroidota bacterium]|nr:fructose-6-phosphate aldolase [Bacteroidota bacterium]
MFFILKIKGTKTIPDFVQIRNSDMTLRAYFRLSQQEIGLKKNKLEEYTEPIMKLLKEIPFGKIHELKTND